MQRNIAQIQCHPVLTVFALNARNRLTGSTLELEHFSYELRHRPTMPMTATRHHANVIDIFQFGRNATHENLVGMIAAQHFDEIVDLEDTVQATCDGW